MSRKTSSAKFPIKGFREGLLITIGEGEWEEMIDALLLQIDERSDFFRGAKIAIDIGERALNAAELGRLRDEMSGRGVSLCAVLGKSAMTQAVSESLGLSTEPQVLKQTKNEVGLALTGGEDAILIQKSIRSGMLVKYPGHVIVDGDVNPGAEILAGGSIYIWGKLRGTVHAGIGGAEGAVICALEMNSQNLRIANIGKIDYSFLSKLKKTPKKVYLEDTQLIIADWKQKLLSNK